MVLMDVIGTVWLLQGLVNAKAVLTNVGSQKVLGEQ
jgi:hypothetical protein